MAAPWAILTSRYGEEVDEPSPAQLLDAAEELYNENVEGMGEGEYAEHPNAWLRYGTDDGPMYVVDAYRDGTVIVSRFADQDFGEPSHQTTLSDVQKDRLLELWTWLANGDFETIRSRYPALRW